MPSAEDLIKKVISNNTVNVQIMTPELEKKLEEMEERQTEQHEETIETQKKTKDEFAKLSNQGSSNFKEGGEMINKGIKGLTGVDIGGKFNDLKEKIGDLGNIFKGFGKLLKFQGGAELLGAGAEFRAVGIAKQELSVTEKLKESIDRQTRLGEKERKSEVASRIQKEQPVNIKSLQEKLELAADEGFDLRGLNYDEVFSPLSDAVKKISEGKTVAFDELGNLGQDKDVREQLVTDTIKKQRGILNSIEGIDELGEDFDLVIRDIVENASRLAYELRSVDLNPEGQLVTDPTVETFGGFNLTETGQFATNPKGILEGLDDNLKTIEKFEDLTEEQKVLLDGFGLNEEFIKSYGGSVKSAVEAISRNTVESVEVLRNTIQRNFEVPQQEENLQQELKQQQNVMSENVDDEQTQKMMNFLSNLPPILEVLKDQYEMDEDQRDKLFGGQKTTGSIVDKDGNPISSDDFKSPMDGVRDALQENGRGLLDAVVQGGAFGLGSKAAGSFGGQKPKPPATPKGTTAPKGGVKPAGGGILRGLMGGIAGFLGSGAGVATAIALGVGIISAAGLRMYEGSIANEDEDKGEGDSDYAKRKKEELDQKRTELQGDETNFLGMQKITAESIIDDNTFAGGKGFFDTVGNLLQGNSEIYFDKLNQDDALLRLDQLMAADDLIGDDLSKEDRKRLDQELRDAQTAAQKQLQEMQEQTGERLTLEELGKYYDFEVLGENMLKNLQPPAMVTDNSVVNNSTTITSANPRQYDNDVDRAQGAAYT